MSTVRFSIETHSVFIGSYIIFIFVLSLDICFCFNIDTLLSHDHVVFAPNLSTHLLSPAYIYEALYCLVESICFMGFLYGACPHLLRLKPRGLWFRRHPGEAVRGGSTIRALWYCQTEDTLHNIMGVMVSSGSLV